MPDMLRIGSLGEQDRRNERNFCINVPTEEGKKVFFRLVESSDILVESSKGGQWKEWGLPDEVLWEHNPALVIVHLSGFGQTGDPRFVSRPGYDAVAQAFACHMQFNGFEDRHPVPAAPYVCDYLGALMGLSAALAAFHKAKETGVGDSIDLAQFEVLLREQGRYIIDYLTYDKHLTPRNRNNTSSDKYAGWGLYKCKDDKYIYAVLTGSGVFRKNIGMLGLEYGSENYPKGSLGSLWGDPGAEELEKRMREYCLSKTAQEIDDEFYERGIPCSMVMNFEDTVDHPHYKAREVYTEWENMNGETIKGVNVVPKFKNHPGKIWRAMPNIGQDNDDILTELGYSQEEIEKLYAEKIIRKD